ncbi:MAG: hypothetical protein HFE77_04980 [Clostridiales bacterium]|nr:hypothetical protein [Clostridiales bacterium]
MKDINRFVTFLALFLFIFALSAISVVAADSLASTVGPDHCYHSGVFDFNEKTMTLDGVYVGNTIEWLMDDVDFYGDRAVVYENGNIVTQGYLQEGMTVAIYHDDQLYGEI